MEFKFLHVGKELYGKEIELRTERTSSFKRKVTYVNKKQGVEYAFKSKKLKELLSNTDD